MKSLDDLIRHLLEEVALCGDHGAGTLDFFNFVNAYYGQKASSDSDSNSYSSNVAPVDRKFLEKVWTWLTRHPEILVGADGKASTLSLSEVERRNASTNLSQQGRSTDDASPTPQDRGLHDLHSDALPVKKSNRKATHANLSQPLAELRLYATMERRWQAIAGHPPDKVRIPSMDFACLSIIAAHREHGILQPDLIGISGQDKRSVPERTRRLHVGGYICKTPVLIRGLHTSKLVLTRYVQKSSQGDDAASGPSGADAILRNREDTREKEIDFEALQRKLFDILRTAKLITYREIKDILGFTGLRWPTRVLASHLRRLERYGCIKQVRAFPEAITSRTFLFRCIKYIRDPEGREWKSIALNSRARPKPAVAETHDNLSDDEEDYEAEEARYLAGIDEGHPLKDLKEVGRLIPRWTGDGALTNLLFDLIDASGTSGVSTMELKNLAMGRFFLRPTEHLLSKLVDLWQISQPLHLRHLGIVRDTALTNGIPHYVHYSFGNFKKLVDEGKASWEPVMTITKDHKHFKNAAAIDAEPNTDVDGFSKLSDSLFQGCHNDASLADCVKGIDSSPLPMSNLDPKVIKFKDGTWGLQVRSQLLDPRPPDSSKRTPAVIEIEERPQRQVFKRRKIEKELNLVVGARGRGRKIQAEGLPANFAKLPLTQRRRILQSQRAAELYKKSKIVAAIKTHLADDEDRYSATAAVLALATAQYRDSGQEPPWIVMEEIRSETLAPVLLALEGSDPATCRGQNRFNDSNLSTSIVAHSRPLRLVELQLIGDIFRSRIRCLQMVRIEGSAQKMAQAGRLDHDAMPVDDRVAQDLLTNRQWQPLTGGTTNAVPSPPIRGTGKWPRKKKETVARKPRPKATPRKTSGKPSGDILLTVNAMVDRYLPSVAAHLLPLQSTALADAGTSSLKRKRPVDQASESARPQRQRKKVDKDFELVPLSITRAPRSGQTNQPQTYQQQMSSIVRHTPGVYLGMECKLYQPGKSGAKRKSRLLILRFSCSQLLSDVCLQSSPAQDTPLAQSEMLQQCMTEMADNGGASQTPLEPIRHPSTQEREATIQKRRIIDDEASEDPIFPSNTPTTASPAAGSPSVPAYTLTSVETANSQSQMLPEGGSMFALHVGRDSSLPLPSRVVNPSQRKPILDCVSSDHRTFSEIQEGHSEAQKERSGDDSSTNNGKLKERQNAAHSNISTRPGSTDEETAQQRVPADLRVSPIEVQGDSANPPLPAAPSQNDPQTSFVGDGPSTDDRLALRRAVSTPLNNDQIRYSLNDGAEITKPTASGSSSTRKSPEAHSPSPLLSDLAHEPSKGSVLPVISEDTPRPKANTGVQKMTTKGGTVAALRRKIVMDIVERCGGLFPGASELGIPFQSEWIKSGRTGKVEKSTIRAVVKYLCDNGKLRQITFAIEEQGGGVTTKTIITKTEIGTTDPRVIRMRDAIIEAHPDLYLPDELEVPPRIRQGWNLKGRKMRTVKDLEVDQELVQLPTKPRDMQSHERKKEARKELEEYWDAVVRLIEANGGTLPEDKDIVDEDIKEFLYTTYAQRRLFVLSKKPAPVKSQRKVDRLASRIEGHADYQADRLRFIASPKEEALRRIAELTRKKTQRESEGDRNQNMAQGPKLPTYRRIEQGSSEARGIKRRRTQFNRVDMTLHSSAARQQMYTIMEPEHIFHPATGTFSVNFSRFRTPNQIMERYHWQRPANQYHAFSHSHGTMHFPPVKRRGPLEILRDLGALPSTKRRRSRTATDASSNPSRQASVAAATVTKQTTFSKPFKTRQLTAVEKITLPTKGRAALNASARSETDGINHRKKREPAPDPERARRIMTAVTVIRTLIGGIQQNIDWVLVAQALPPAYTQESINIEWEKVRKAYTNQVQQMESEFQALFLKAYSEDLVPPIDYDNLHAYDWAWLVEWTIENLGAPLDEGLSLPSERGRLHELFGLSTSEDPTLNNFYEFDTYLTIAKREADLHKRAWVRPLSRGLSKLDLASPKEGVIEVAKTWIRAVVVTKAEVYNAQFAADQLTRFDNSVQNQALTEMLADRVLMQENKGRIIPGRNYDLNEQYLRPLRKKIEAASFRKGPVFKQYIDEALAGGKEMIVPHMADDALAMAIFNMHAHHRVSLVAKNPPLEPWGLGGPEHYKTKEIDKKKFIFDVGLRATESYIYGNPLFPLPAPPAPRPLGPKDTATKLPLWVDLNGSVIPELWQLSLAATMSVLAMRPGASAKTLETSLKPCLGAWEIELLLVWMVDAHAAKRLEGGHGFLTAEWWWLCFGDGQEIEGRGDEQGDVQMGGT